MLQFLSSYLTSERFQTLETNPVAALKAVLGGFPSGRHANCNQDRQQPPLRVRATALPSIIYNVLYRVLFIVYRYDAHQELILPGKSEGKQTNRNHIEKSVELAHAASSFLLRSYLGGGSAGLLFGCTGLDRMC